MNIIVYSKPGCPYCQSAKTLLHSLHLPFSEIQLNPLDSDYSQKRDTLFKHFKHYSYPIILVGNKLVGGYSELVHSYDTLKLHSLCADIGLRVK